MMNWKKYAYLTYATLRGYRFPHLFRQYAREFDQNRLADTARQGLARLLRHCRTAVPYYAQFWKDTTESQWDHFDSVARLQKIGRASCRERV